MALARLQYLEHLRAALHHALAQHPELVPGLMLGLVDFVPSGPSSIGGLPTTLANRREAARILIGVLWTSVLQEPFSGHQIRHYLRSAGLPEALTEDVPQVAEPAL